MKKFLLAFGFISVLAGFASAQESSLPVNVDESFVQESQAAVYKEWTGGYSPEEINTQTQIMDIGRRLGKGIKYQEANADPNPFNKGNPAYKYSAARIYGNEKRGADVILIGQSAAVDTIKCLKMIIRGYLTETFGYSFDEAKAYAENICYWNTNNFNNREYFERNFEQAVLDVFSDYSSKIGLSENYSEWKKSVIIIPHTFSGFLPSYENQSVSVDEYEINPENTASQAEEQAQSLSSEVPDSFSAPAETQTPSEKSIRSTNSGSSFPLSKILLISGIALAALVLIIGIVIAVMKNR